MPVAAPIDRTSTALLVVDVQNDFCHPDGLCARVGYDVANAAPALEAARRLLSAARGADLPIVHVRLVVDWETETTIWLDQLRRLRQPLLTVDGTFGADFCDGFEPLPGEVVITKTRYSAFVRTGLDEQLHAAGITHVVVCGVATNICVQATAQDALMRDFAVTTVGDACGAFTRDGHDAALTLLGVAYGSVATVDDVTRELTRARSGA